MTKQIDQYYRVLDQSDFASDAQYAGRIFKLVQIDYGTEEVNLQVDENQTLWFDLFNVQEVFFDKRLGFAEVGKHVVGLDDVTDRGQVVGAVVSGDTWHLIFPPKDEGHVNLWPVSTVNIRQAVYQPSLKNQIKTKRGYTGEVIGQSLDGSNYLAVLNGCTYSLQHSYDIVPKEDCEFVNQ